LAVQVVAGRELRPRRALDVLVEGREGAALRLRKPAVRAEREADVRPVAVRVDPVTVVALEEDPALGDRAAAPAVRVRVGEVDDRLLEDVRERRRAALDARGHDLLAREAGRR